MNAIRLMVISCSLFFSQAWAVTPCSEHGYCEPQGLPLIRHQAEFSPQQKTVCAEAEFRIQFGLENGRPVNVKVISGPEDHDLWSTLEESFGMWRFSALLTLEAATEMVHFDESCSLRMHQGAQQIVESQQVPG